MPDHRPPHLVRLHVRNYRSLRDVDVPLGPLNVLVGPNGSGKSTLLEAVGFLSDCAHLDLERAVELYGGYESLKFRDGSEHPWISFDAEAVTGEHDSTPSSATYSVRFRSGVPRDDDSSEQPMEREEELAFAGGDGGGRRIRVESTDLTTEIGRVGEQPTWLDQGSLALATLPKLGGAYGGREVKALAAVLRSVRKVEIDVAAARRPRRANDLPATRLRNSAANLGPYLQHLAARESEVFEQVQRDARLMIPGLREIVFRPTSGAVEGLVIQLVEQGLDGPTDLGEASFGSVRALALLALLHDPRPARITCIEEIDHGLHPYVLDRVVELLREASQRTQLLVTTHAPALVNRLNADELVVCERDASGASQIPAIAAEDVRRMEKDLHGELELGELWFTGALGGVPQG